MNGAWKAQKNKEGGKEAAYGWVISEKGMISARGKEKICSSTPSQAEAYALLYGILGAQKKGLQSSKIWSDAKCIVEGCRNPSNMEVDIRTIISDILLLLGKFSSVILFHVPRPKVNLAHPLVVEAREE